MALTDNLVAYYKLNGNANSEVGGLNGTTTNVSFSTDAGKLDQGAQFASVAGNKIALNHSALNLSTYTINMWIKTSWTGATREVIYSRGNTWTNGQGTTFFLADGTPKALSVQQGGSYGSGSKLLVANATSLIPVDTWVMMTYTFGSGSLKLYVNGTLAGSASASYNSSTAESRLGLRGDNTDYYRGKMDEVGFWSRVLSDAEIVSLYNGGNALTHPFVVGPTETDINKGAQYAVVSKHDTTKGAQYAVVSRSGITKTAGYAINTKTSIDISAGYSVPASNEITKSAQYVVSSGSEVTRGAQYAVTTKTSIDISSQYSIKADVGITKSAGYSIPVKNDLTKGAQYMVKYTPMGSINLMDNGSFENVGSPVTDFIPDPNGSLSNWEAINSTLSQGQGIGMVSNGSGSYFGASFFKWSGADGGQMYKISFKAKGLAGGENLKFYTSMIFGLPIISTTLTTSWQNIEGYFSLSSGVGYLYFISNTIGGTIFAKDFVVEPVTNWNQLNDGTSTIAVLSDVASLGTKGLKIQCDSYGVPNGISQRNTIPVSPNTLYSLTMNVKSSASGNIYLTLTDESGNRLQSNGSWSSGFVYSTISSTTSFSKYTLNFVTGPSQTAVYIESLIASGQASKTFYVDDIRIFEPIPALNLSAGYAIKPTIDVEVDASYLVKAKVGITKSSQYIVLFGEEITKSAGYAVKAISGLTKSASYLVKFIGAISKSAGYAVKTPGDIDKGAQYTIKTTIGISKSAGYAMRFGGNIEKAGKYVVTSPKSISKGGQYIVKFDSTIDVGATYAIRSDVGITKAGDYAIRTENSIDVGATYIVRFESAITKVASYIVRFDSAISKTAGYAVRFDSAISKTAGYAVRFDSAISKSAQYVLRYESGITKSASYKVVIENSIEKVASYAIRSEQGITKSAEYAVRFDSAITKAGAYKVIFTTSLSKSGQYVLKYDSAITKSAGYAIRVEQGITKGAQYKLTAVKIRITKSAGYNLRIYPYTDKINAYGAKIEAFGAKKNIYTPFKRIQ